MQSLVVRSMHMKLATRMVCSSISLSVRLNHIFKMDEEKKSIRITEFRSAGAAILKLHPGDSVLMDLSTRLNSAVSSLGNSIRQGVLAQALSSWVVSCSESLLRLKDALHCIPTKDLTPQNTASILALWDSIWAEAAKAPSKCHQTALDTLEVFRNFDNLECALSGWRGLC